MSVEQIAVLKQKYDSEKKVGFLKVLLGHRTIVMAHREENIPLIHAFRQALEKEDDCTLRLSLGRYDRVEFGLNLGSSDTMIVSLHRRHAVVQMAREKVNCLRSDLVDLMTIVLHNLHSVVATFHSGFSCDVIVDGVEYHIVDGVLEKDGMRIPMAYATEEVEKVVYGSAISFSRHGWSHLKEVKGTSGQTYQVMVEEPFNLPEEEPQPIDYW